MRNPKTVYILGAGFSKPVGAPLQSEIIQEILELEKRDFGLHNILVQNYIKEFKNLLEKKSIFFS